MKVLVLGSTGMIGHRLILELIKKTDYQIIGVSRKTLPSKFNQFENFKFKNIDNMDLLDFDILNDILSKEDPDIIINAVGTTIRKLNEQPHLSDIFRTNSQIPRKLEHWCNKNKKRLIHFSTDCVFDGKDGNYVEDDFPTAIDSYGLSKQLGEVSGRGSLTLRLSVVGREIFSKTELLEWFLGQEGCSIKGYKNVIYSGLPMASVATEVVRVIKDFPSLTGLYHISSKPITKLDLLILLKKEFNLKCEINPCDNVKSDKSLVCQKYIKATGFKQPDWNELVHEMADDFLNLYTE